VQDRNNFNCLEIVLISDSFLLLVVAKMIGITTQSILELEGPRKANTDRTIFFDINERGQVLDVKTGGPFLNYFLYDIKVFRFNQGEICKVNILTRFFYFIIVAILFCEHREEFAAKAVVFAISLDHEFNLGVKNLGLTHVVILGLPLAGVNIWQINDPLKHDSLLYEPHFLFLSAEQYELGSEPVLIEINSVLL
jgi:hypothetical protein